MKNITTSNLARAIAYCRVSTVRQAEHELSLDEQLNKIRNYSAHKDAEIIKVFVDRGASGRTEKRPEFQQLIKFASDPQNAVKFVIVYNFARFFRNATAYLQYRKILGQFGVKLVSVTQDIPDGFSGELMETIFVAFDAHQSEANAATVRDMMRANAENGNWNGSPVPFGYNLIEGSRSGTKIRKRLGIDESDANVVRMIYRFYLQGCGAGSMGIKQVATHLNGLGIFRKGKPWSVSGIERILKSETYVGKAYFNRMDSRSRKLRPRDEWIELATPAIVDREKYGQVQEMLAFRNPRKTPPRLVNSQTLLSAVATCGWCATEGVVRNGMVLRTGKGGRYRYLVCNARANKSLFLCDSPAIPMDLADEAIISALELLVFTPERLRALLAEMIAANQNDTISIIEELKRLAAAQARAEGGLRALYRGAAERSDLFDLNDPLFREQISELKMQRASFAGQIEALEKRKCASDNPITDARIEQFSNSARRKLRDGDPQFRRTWLRHFVSEIVVGQEDIRILVRKDTVSSGPTEVPSFDREWRALRESNPSSQNENLVS